MNIPWKNDTTPDTLEEKRMHDREEYKKLRNIVAQQSTEIQALKVN